LAQVFASLVSHLRYFCAMSSSSYTSNVRRASFTLAALEQPEMLDIEGFSLCAAYGTFLLTLLVVLWQISDMNFSVVCTIGSGLQCLAFILLALKMRAAKSARGISAKSLQIYVLVFVCKLTSTLNKEGYLPIDKTGDWVYQVCDLVTLLLVLLLLGRIYTTNASTYSQDADSFRIAPMLAVCLGAALLLKGDLNRSLLYDTAWMLSVALDTVAMVPQLWLLSKLGGAVDALTSHFIALLFASRALIFAFWFVGYPELAPLEGWNACGYAHVVLHFTQLLLCADFIYYYVKAGINQEALVLPELDV